MQRYRLAAAHTGNPLRPPWFKTCLLTLLLIPLVPVGLAGEDLLTKKQRITPDYLDPEESRTVQLYRKVLPALVTVIALHRKLNDANEFERLVGSRVIIEPESYILTNVRGGESSVQGE